MRHIGVTGHREPMTLAEIGKLQELFLAAHNAAHGRVVLHHGDCEGVDATAHSLALGLRWMIEVHPPTDDRYRAFMGGLGVTIHEPKPYLERNTDIANASDQLFACPTSKEAVLRSGTWSTIRRAERRGIPIEVF